MKKISKAVSVLLLFCLMFTAGYLGCRENGFVGKKKELLLFMKSNNARNINENVAGAKLDEEDAQFISEHVLGQWKISERISEIKGADNISSQGIEELKTLVFIYDKDFAMINGYDRHTFSNRDDIFLYLSYGGNMGLIYRFIMRTGMLMKTIREGRESIPDFRKNANWYMFIII